MSDSYKPMSDARIAELTALAKEHRARIYILRRVRVKQDRDWQEAINLGGPDTPLDFNVRKSEVDYQYQPTSSDTVEKDIILLRYFEGEGWENALMWGEEAKLKKTVPREVFAIGEQYPSLDVILRQNPISVSATTGCTFGSDTYTCLILWWNLLREAHLGSVVPFVSDTTWFAFSDE